MGTGFYVSNLEERKIEDLFMTIMDRPIPVETVSKSFVDPTVLEVDIEKAWKKMGLRATWSNETVLKFFL